MAENTSIEWCDHTFNPWQGCTKVSEGCKHCYAMGIDDRFSKESHWGPKGDRKPASEAAWKAPLKWQKQCEQTGTLARVFCASMGDVFDDHESIQWEWRERLAEVIQHTPNLEWLLLTKRPQNVFKMPALPTSNVRIGVSVENQEVAEERLPILKDIKRLYYPTFVSYEPALGPVDFRPWLAKGTINWVIAGGESGSKARPSELEWFTNALEACQEFGVPFFFKQWGNHAPGMDGKMKKYLRKADAGHLLEGHVHREFPAPHTLELRAA